jgi:hypothetical protein
VPFDLVMELLPFPIHDRHHLHYRLVRQTEEDVDPAKIIRRGQALRGQLEGKGTPPETRPATRPKTGPTTR